MIDFAEKIASYIKNHATEDEALGIEIEHFILDNNNKSVLYSYDDKKTGIREILEELAPLYDEKIYEVFNGQKNIVGLKRKDAVITIEPGAQLEVSIKKNDDIEKIYDTYKNFLNQTNMILKDHDYKLVNTGYRPDMCALEVPIIPKMRYHCMDANFKTVDNMGFCMMRCTAATQITIDFNSEEDCMKKMKIATAISPLIYFLLDNCEVFERCNVGDKKETPSGFTIPKRMTRWEIWNHADNDRCTSLECVFNNRKTADVFIDNYAKAIDNLPNVYDPVNLSEQERIKHKLSMCFYDVRLKNAIEIRPADSMPIDYTFAYLHFIQNIFYNNKALNKMWNLFSKISFEDYKQAGKNLQKDGWNAQIYGKKATDIYDSIVKICKIAKDEKTSLILDLIKSRKCLHEVIEHQFKETPGKYSPIAKTEQNTKIMSNFFLENKGCLHDRTEFVAARQNSKVAQHEKVSNTAYFPKIFGQDTMIHFQSIINKTNDVLNKVIDEYYKNPEYAKLFKFDDFSLRLINFRPKYKQKIPIARYDVFYDDVSRKFMFCEFNTGGAAAMTKTKFANEEIVNTLPYQKIQIELRNQNKMICNWSLLNSWVHEFAKIFTEWQKNTNLQTKNMRVGMVDFLDNCQLPDFEPFKKSFISAGYDCEICDIRDLRYNGIHLMSKEGKVLDAIYKRVTLDDLLNYADDEGVDAMISAVLDDAVCPIDWFNTQIVHDKQLFAILHHPMTKAILSPSENSFVEKTIPETWIIDKEIAENNHFIKHKDEYIIKPISSRDSKNIHPGKETETIVWNSLIQKFAKNQNYIIQKYCPIYTSDNVCIDIYNKDESLERNPKRAMKQYSNMDGLFCYNGYFVGLYLRQGNHKKKATMFDMTVPCFYEC